jgi:hypothetical protein
VKATPVVVKLLLSETENVKTNAVWATSLALENEQTQQKFVEEGGVPVSKLSFFLMIHYFFFF